MDVEQRITKEGKKITQSDEKYLKVGQLFGKQSYIPNHIKTQILRY